MKRPWQIWVAFGVCFVVVLTAMGWVSWQALCLDRAQVEAQRRAGFEERVRLALGRMDFAVSRLIARESERPYPHYNAFYFAGQPLTKTWVQILKDEVLLPSPLLAVPHEEILLHFQMESGGRFTSPQVPTGNALDVVETRKYRTPQDIKRAGERLARLQKLVSRDVLLQVESTPSVTIAPRPSGPSAQADLQSTVSTAYQLALNRQERDARVESQRLVQQKAQEEGDNVARLRGVEVKLGTMKPIWTNEVLLLVRKLKAGRDTLVQGCWLDWERIRTSLLAEVNDLLPEAELEPTTVACEDEAERLLASLPVRLLPGEVAAGEGDGISPIVLSLVIAWACVLLAAGAAAMLLSGAVSLSERRGAFVSAVTHELRTPLTTFRMYTEMLEDDMITDETRRKDYLGTLRTEAERLGHLVENVLAYARLEKGSARGRIETVSLAKLVGRAEKLLAARAEQADMQFVVENEEDIAGTVVRADTAAVEQILFNLVDNACKYAAAGEDKHIHLRTERTDGAAVLRICDHGPGISPEDAKKLFRPFTKSARDAANSAPGVGLGLALSRRLAREMHGDLTLDDRSFPDGACFVLTLPLA